MGEWILWLGRARLGVGSGEMGAASRDDVVWNDSRYYVSDDRRYWRSGYWQ